MAGDWIKMRGNLWDDPRIARLVDLTDSSEAAVIGGLYWLWATADQHTADGIMPGLSTRQIDRKTGVQGLGQALVDVGWLADHPEGVRIVNFEDHNGASAKKRAQTAKRVSNHRAGNASETQEDESCNAPSVTGALAREEKRREEEKHNPANAGLPGIEDSQPSAGPPKPVPPVCPHQEIIALYHEKLPTATRVRVWNDTRAKHLLARWREDPKRQSLDWWTRFFDYVAQSDFLTGQAAAAPGRDPFVVSLDWLVAPQNFAKTVEGKYHRSAA